MNNLVPVIRCLNNFRRYSNSYKYLSFGALMFLVWQVVFHVLVKITDGSIVNNRILIAFAIVVFIIGAIILLKAFWDFYQVVIKNVFSSDNINKPIWLYDSFLILYILTCIILSVCS